MTPQPPDLPPELELVRRLPSERTDLELSGAVLEAELPLRARRIRLRECELRGVEVQGGPVALDLSDVVVGDCDLSNVEAGEGHLRRVEFRRSRLIGFSLRGGRARDLRVADCTLALGSLASAGLQDVVFDSVNLSDATFQDARMRNVQFVDCELAGTDFRGARLTDCRLRGTPLDGVVGVESLRGLAMPWPDIVASAGALAAALGIRAED